MNENENTLPFAPTELDQAVNAFISTAQKEFGEPEPADGVLESAPSVESTPEVGAPNVPVETASSPLGPEDPTERGLERLVAREVELREREVKLARETSEIEALRARLRELEPRAMSPELLNKLKLSPADGLRALGLDPDEIIRTALAEKIGDKATPEMRDLLEKTKLRREMEALRAQVQEAERQRAAQAYYSQVANGAQSFLSKHEELSKHSPTVAHVAKTAPERAYNEIMEEITRDAASRARQEPNGDILSYEDAAKRVEARWSGLKKMLGAESVAAQLPVIPASTPGASAAPPETKQNVGKSTPATIKPPEKPLAPWLRTSKDEEDAIKSAIAEWNRAEFNK